MIGVDDLDLHALRRRTEILDRELRRRDGAGAGIVGIKARHVGQDADLDDAVGVLREGGAAREEDRERSECECRG